MLIFRKIGEIPHGGAQPQKFTHSDVEGHP